VGTWQRDGEARGLAWPAAGWWSAARLLRPLCPCLTPCVPAGTWLVVDGEVVPFKQLFMEVHPSLCTAVVAPTVR
jgi:hypothetical protein